METMDIQFAKHIEKLRISRNFSRESLLEGIISDRQYRRYLKGESSIQSNFLNKIIERMDLDIITVYTNFQNNNDNILSTIKESYNLIRGTEFQKSRKLLEALDENELGSNYNLKFYNFCIINLDIKQKRIKKSTGFNLLAANINYPDCLKKNTLNFYEIVTLIAISDYFHEEKGDEKIVSYLYSLLSDEDFTSIGLHFTYLPSIYANVGKTLFKQKDYLKALQISDIGIKVCRKYELFNALSNILYHKAACLKKLERFSETDDVLETLKALLLVEGNEKKREAYLKTIRLNL